jgi:transporter family-2 protein
LRLPAPHLRSAGSGPWWLWLGGLIGAAFVFGALFVAPRIGAASFAAATIFGSAVASLAIDQFGWFGFEQRPLSALRFAGAACLLLGIVLLQAGR